jgi:hypothetical protein
MIEQSEAEALLDEQKKLELRFRLVKDEIASQANTFDQLDSKTGVALGFTFVVIGQVLALVFRMATTDNSQFHSAIPYLSNGLFGLANLFAVLGVGFGVKARWPCEFQHSIELSQEELTLAYPEMLDAAFKCFSEIVVANEKKLASKGWWAAGTYLFVGLALVTYLALAVFLYFTYLIAR